MKEQILSKAVEAGGRLRVKSALNPILWLCGIITIPTLVSSVISQNMPTWVTIIGVLPVVMAMFGFLFLLFFDRDKLQSEDYQLRKRTIELSQQKGDLYPIEVGKSKVIENPDLATLQNNRRGNSNA